jgi:glycosyltransferase involved in cell wall biosynthesis
LVVSVVIPAHNEPYYLAQTLASLRAQTHTSMEALIIDDASDPSLEGAVAAFGDDRFRYIRLDRNLERAGARNVGLHEARGDFFMPLDHDDLLDPDAVAVLVRMAIAADADVVFGRSDTIGADIIVPWRSDLPRHPESAAPIDWSDVFRFNWTFGNGLYANWIREAISFDPLVVPADDYKFAVEAALISHAVRVDHPLAAWRRHSRQTSASFDEQARLAAVKRAQDSVLKNYEVPRGARRRALGYQALYQEGYSAWRSRNWPRLLRCTFCSAWRDPVLLSNIMWWKALGSLVRQLAIGVSRFPRHDPITGTEGRDPEQNVCL